MNPQKHSPTGQPKLSDFLVDQDDATKEKYASEIANASPAWRKPLDRRYAESLVYFGELERMTKIATRKGRVTGSRTWFRKVQKTTPTVEYFRGSVNQLEAA